MNPFTSHKVKNSLYLETISSPVCLSAEHFPPSKVLLTTIFNLCITQILHRLIIFFSSNVKKTHYAHNY